MANFFRTLSRGTLAFLIISLAIVLIVANDPPHDLCRSELEQLKKVQDSFLNPSASLKKAFKNGKSPSQRLYTRCSDNQSSGTCLEYFIKLRTFSRDYAVVSGECRNIAYRDKSIKSIIDKALALMVQIAWNERQNREIATKYGWFDQADLALYCEYRKFGETSQSKSSWNGLQQSILASLEGASDLSQEAAWKGSLLSTSCKKLR